MFHSSFKVPARLACKVHLQTLTHEGIVAVTSPYTFITVDCYLVAFFSKWVKIAPPWPHHGHVDHRNYDFEMELGAVQLIPVE
jgi:hypothetical protein